MPLGFLPNDEMLPLLGSNLSTVPNHAAENLVFVGQHLNFVDHSFRFGLTKEYNRCVDDNDG